MKQTARFVLVLTTLLSAMLLSTSLLSQSLPSQSLPSNAVAPVRQPGTRMWVDAAPKLSFRVAPAGDAEKIGAIKYEEEVAWLEETGEPFTVDGRTGRWAKVKYDGKEGYVFGGLLQEYRLYPFNKGSLDNKKLGLFDRRGNVIVKPRFTAVGEITTSEAFTAAETHDKWAVYSPQGSRLSSGNFKWVQPFSEGLATAGRADDRYFFLDVKGRDIVTAPAKCGSVGGLREGLAYCQYRVRPGDPDDVFLDRQGVVVLRLPAPYFGADKFSGGLTLTTKKIGRGYAKALVDRSGKTRFVTGKDGFEWVDEVADDRARVVRNGKYGFIDTGGNIVIEPRFDWVGRFSEGLAPFGEGAYRNDCRGGTRAKHWDNSCDTLFGKFGFIDKTGEVVIEPTYDDVRGFSEGLAAVANGEMVERVVESPMDTYTYQEFVGKYGYINRSGKLWIKASFRAAKPFHNGLAHVKKGRGFIYINKWGKTAFANAGPM